MSEVAIVAVVFLLAQAATTIVFLQVSRARAREQARERREWTAERRDYADRLMHMADHTWTPPPQVDYPDETVREEVFYPETTLNTTAGF